MEINRVAAMLSDTTASLALLRSKAPKLSFQEQLDLLQQQSLSMPSSSKVPTPVVEISGSIFLEKTPLKIRHEIYFHLLVSDKTSDLTRHRDGYGHGYGGSVWTHPWAPCDNTFAMDCTVSTSASKDADQLSPNTLSRHPLRCAPDWPYALSVKNLPAFERVQHWKVIVLPENGSMKSAVPQRQVVSFCRAACRIATLKSLVISTCDCLDNGDDRQLMWHIRDQKKFRAQRQVNLMVALKPIEMFRGLDTFDVKCSSCDKSVAAEKGEIAQLKSLVESKEPVHHVFKTYEALLNYAQAFERIPMFRNDMASERRNAKYSMDCFNRRVIPDPKDLNPYIFAKVHPVEAALRLARTAVDNNNYEKFKEHRITVLGFLEPQYTRMPVMSDEIVKLVEKQTKLGVCHGLHQYRYGVSEFEMEHDDDLKVICLIKLDDYAKTFIRDSPDEVRIVLRRYGWIANRLHAELPRERHLRDLQTAYDMKDLIKFREIFLLAVKDMYDQWLNIRQARRKLLDFDWDTEDTGCTIDLELWRDDSPLQLPDHGDS
ncbi:hypothetical protein IFR05_002986 [Cadophora sp. M221]|nr:hypothetical protein IFR05_002986 [Cadophora sp. M221]